MSSELVLVAQRAGADNRPPAGFGNLFVGLFILCVVQQDAQRGAVSSKNEYHGQPTSRRSASILESTCQWNDRGMIDLTLVRIIATATDLPTDPFNFVLSV